MNKSQQINNAIKLTAMPSVSDLVKMFKLTARRKLSQNFLLDQNINDKIVRSMGNLKDGAFHIF